ncbi:MAG: DUF697 domain-containing protein, partial [Desulfovibrionaceae bacterium]|nr:DUF697 domain-containing protein [Desulfovibrionaceae bacterium]
TQAPTPHELEENGLPLRVIDMPGVGEAGHYGERLNTVLHKSDQTHLILIAVPCPERNLDYESTLLAEINKYFANRTGLPRLDIATKIDCAAPVREWDPKKLNLSHPTTSKEQNIVAWLKYVQSALPDLGNMLPCSLGENYADQTQHYGLGAIRQKIFEILPEAARTFFARLTKDKLLLDIRAEKIVRKFSAMASAAAAQPVPAVPDAALIMPIQIAMLSRLTKLHGRELTADLATKLLGSLAARLAGRFAFEQLSKFIPGIGQVMGPAIAGGMTYALGMSFHTLLCGGNWNFNVDELKKELLIWWDKIEKTF